MKAFVFPLVLIFSLASCNQEELDKLKEENQQLEQKADQKDSSINDMMATFNEIENNLAEIKAREQMVEISREGDTEGGAQYDRTEKIKEDIQMINYLLEENKKMIENLNAKLKASDLKVSEFRTMVNRLQTQLKEKDEQIAELRGQLSSMNIQMDSLHFTLDTLSLANQKQRRVIEEKITQVNTAYYAYGTYEELEEQNVLAKSGGFLGLGKDEVLRDDFNKEYFSKIDITKQKSFLIYAEEARLISTHPAGSYEFMGTENSVDSLVITSPDEFWKASKYMVVLVE